MENLTYLIYLMVVLLSTILISFVGRIKIDYMLALKAIAPVLLIFVVWDIAATELGHWSFGYERMLGIVIINQPIEELLFFIVIPLFYIIVWEAVKKHVK
jgi:lycopene cyclase domain-containing protein